jgi:HAD superfamily hydrolase (TIGR01459 family)
MTVKILPGISALLGDYDHFILDLWGVVHDGATPYPGAVDCLRRMREAGKAVLMLSNAPRRAETVIERMDEMGIDRGLYDQVVSSGELAHWALKKRDDPWHARLGRKCLHVGPARDDGIVEGLDIEMVSAPEEAEFVLITGPWRDDERREDYDRVLDLCAGHGLAMVCANPDLEVIRGEKRFVCAGTLAAHYETLGGDVYYHGKPHAPAYEACLKLFGAGAEVDGRRVLGVGDTLRTDVAGAEAAGLDSVLVTSGIHAEELGVEFAQPPDPDRLSDICRRAGHMPVAAVPAFIW